VTPPTDAAVTRSAALAIGAATPAASDAALGPEGCSPSISGALSGPSAAAPPPTGRSSPRARRLGRGALDDTLTSARRALGVRAVGGKLDAGGTGRGRVVLVVALLVAHGCGYTAGRSTEANYGRWRRAHL
jgi:hypothetical protein